MVESFRTPQTQNSKLYYVQVGAFTSEQNAQNFKKEVGKTFSGAFVKKVENLYYVQVGAFSSQENAKNYLASVKVSYPDAFIKTF